MSATIVTAERLGKRYRILHQRERQRYVALRDVLADQLRSPLRWLRGSGDGAPAEREDFWALKDVSFEITPGEVVGIIGRNGAGKSTLLKVLSRITEPTEGRLTLDGRVGSLLEVGTGFHPELTGRENISLNGAILGMRRVEITRKFDEIVAFAGVEQFLDMPVKRYSSGMYVRLAFAVAAHLEPEILIVDEVLAVGDAEFQKKCLGKMHEVSRGGRTVLFVSHNMAAIQALCSRVIVLRGGRTIADGDTAGSIATYLAESSQEVAPRLRGPVALGPILELQGLEFTPNPVTSGTKVGFAITLCARESTPLSELALLIFSAQESRVAIVDLRSSGLPVTLDPNQPWTLRGSIARLPLVEGDYRLGLYVATGEFSGDRLDLIELSVAARPSAGHFTPYPAVHRGLVEIDFDIEAGNQR